MTSVESAVRGALSHVKDPEIPVCSITDLGLVERVEVGDDAIAVTLLPTFVGCPALDVIREDAERAVLDVAQGRAVRVAYVFSPPWTTDRITEAGREALKSFGIAPAGSPTLVQLTARCPNCGSPATRIESDFGPTPCRSIRYCDSCRNPFEGFKPKHPEV
ncbi:MAG: 1,2-phenylacetyl-CoA epoxidase subunit PaaD [Actinomycetota bacterium]